MSNEVKQGLVDKGLENQLGWFLQLAAIVLILLFQDIFLIDYGWLLWANHRCMWLSSNQILMNKISFHPTFVSYWMTFHSEIRYTEIRILDSYIWDAFHISLTSNNPPLLQAVHWGRTDVSLRAVSYLRKRLLRSELTCSMHYGYALKRASCFANGERWLSVQPNSLNWTFLGFHKSKNTLQLRLCLAA